MTCRWSWALVFALTALACGGSPGQSEPLRAQEPAPTRPRLVVAVVLDQMGYATLESYLPYLDEDGALRRLAAEGVYQRVAYQHAATYTAAGHASIFTGASPRVHGVMSNRIYDPVRGPIASCDDGSCPVFGHDGRYASPTVLRVPTVGDTLRAAHPDARIVGLSFKDRGSVLPAGQHPDAVVFWDKSAGRFTTSSFYGEAPPAWLHRFVEANPAAERMTVWDPADPALLERVLGPDDREGEGGLGYGATFPHDPNAAGDEPAASAFRATPQSAAYLFDLARSAARELELGADDTPDLLTLSVSTTDYVGHCFGHGSWEYLDNLIRVDRELGRLLRELESERGPIAVLVTSDHGHADVAQAMEGGGRVEPNALLAALDTVIDSEVGEGDWLLSYTEPFLYLSDAALEHPERQLIIDTLVHELPSRAGIERAFDVQVIEQLDGSEDPVDRLVLESVATHAPGQVFVVLSRGWMVDNDDVGASHGTPWDYDREVPVLFAGPGVTPRRGETALDQRHVARTIAALLGIDGPAEAPARPLPGAPIF